MPFRLRSADHRRSHGRTHSGLEPRGPPHERNDALGKLNRANVGAPNQRFRAAGGVNWTRGGLDVDALVRHVGSYDDDAGGGIGSFTTLDLAVAWALGARSGRDLHTTLTLGAANVLDEDPPHVEIAGSYDPRSADPRGRRLFLSVRFEL